MRSTDKHRKNYIKRLLSVKALFHYSVEGKLKVLRHNNSIDRLVRSQVNRYLSSDPANPALNTDCTSIVNRNLLHILKNIERQHAGMEIIKVDIDLIQHLLDCALACEQCALDTLKHSAWTRMTPGLQLSRECSDFCFYMIKQIFRSPDELDKLLASCEAICIACAEEWRKYSLDHCSFCANACDLCAAACQDRRLQLEQPR